MDSILASVRGEGLTGLSRAPFDAVQAVDETVETLRLLLRPRPIRWERPDGPIVAIGDETRFRQVLEQLLENESKYAPSAEGVSIGIWRVGDEVQVYVTDDGPGVPIEDWESVFEPFVRIEGRGRSRGLGHRAVRGPTADERDGRPDLPRAQRVRRQPLRGGLAGGWVRPVPSAGDHRQPATIVSRRPPGSARRGGAHSPA